MFESNAEVTTPAGSQITVALESCSLIDLEQLKSEIEDEIEHRSVDAKKTAALRARELAASVGMTLDELIGMATSGKSKRQDGRSEGKGIPKYRNPENAEQTWTGKGKRPRWILTQIEQGRALEDFKIQ